MNWDDPRVAARVARVYAAPDLAAVREAQVDLLDPRPGWRIADIGCGPGAFAEALSARGARVTAIDPARAMLDAVEARALGCELVQADALDLPLASGSHDAACMVQVLEYVDDPVAALREAARVVRPGGAVLAADTDWDTQGFNVADRALGRRVMHAHADLKPDGWAGRRMRGWLTAAGLEPQARRAVVLDATEWGGDTFIAHNWPNMRRGIERAGQVPAAELARFEAEIEESAASGRSTGASSGTRGARVGLGGIPFAVAWTRGVAGGCSAAPWRIPARSPVRRGAPTSSRTRAKRWIQAKLTRRRAPRGRTP